MKSASRLTHSVMGAWMGAEGIEHGIGEMLQGNIAPNMLLTGTLPFSVLGYSPPGPSSSRTANTAGQG